MFVYRIPHGNATPPSLLPFSYYSDKLRLCLWLDITDAKLELAFSDQSARCSPKERTDAQHLIRACLQGDPERRPTMQDLLLFSFLKERKDRQGHSRRGGSRQARSQSTLVSSVRDTFELRPGLLVPLDTMPPQTHALVSSLQEMVTIESAIDPSQSVTVLKRDSKRARYHLFISHAQTEASGDVGTLFFLFEQMGVNVWRDMNQTDLTGEGMRRGVYDSDVFLLFLTNSYLSRKFCLLELTWALEFGKPIIIIIEAEERFWPFNLERWQQNRCTRVRGGEWTAGALQSTYEECPPAVRNLIETHYADGSMLPFRRRDFEVNAMTRAIVNKASGLFGVVWGSQLPPSGARANLDESARRRIYVIARQSQYTRFLIQECMDSINAVAPHTFWTDDIQSANHVLILLTQGTTDAGTRTAKLIEEAVFAEKTTTFLYVTSDEVPDETWNFGDFYDTHQREPSAATSALSVHEALKYRQATPATIHEHDAMIFEVLRRMRGQQRLNINAKASGAGEGE